MKSSPLVLARLLLFLAGCSTLYSVKADPFTYQSRDLLLCFRKIGAGGGTVSSYDFEVNVGQVSNYIALAAGTVLTNTQVSTAQLAAVFDNLDNLNWSVSATAQRSDNGDPAYPFYTLWTTVPRFTPDSVGTPWTRSSQASQGNPAGKIVSIGTNARTYSGTQPPDATFNTTQAVRVPAGAGQDYGTYIGPNGNYSTTFQGNVENSTPSDFVSSGGVSRSDLCQLLPSSSGGAGTLLGYFELRADGTVVFVRSGGEPPPPPPPPVLSIGRTNLTTAISFTTTNGASYNLRFTNTAGLNSPVSSWPVIPDVVTGDGTTKTLTDTTSDPDRVYQIEAH